LAFRGRSALGALLLRGLPRRAFPAGVSHLSFQSLLCFEILGEIPFVHKLQPPIWWSFFIHPQ
ncbi:hypothetical protein, partial [Peribacillus frigoritolerans]|uniref:hypothetical protein n=1 Tax=Peribacillus frigoritolerans TaxID=450367 RepID=UPI003641D7BE